MSAAVRAGVWDPEAGDPAGEAHPTTTVSKITNHPGRIGLCIAYN